MTGESRGLIVSSPSSRCGKTAVTLGLIRALKRQGHAVRAAKSGPDYIDTRFHQVAAGIPSVNLDAWAMQRDLLKALAASAAAAAATPELLVVEGAMGVLDGAGTSGTGSVADLSKVLELPIVMVIDASRQAHSSVLAPLGLKAVLPEMPLAGVIANMIGSEKHGRTVRTALEGAGLRVFGTIPKGRMLDLPERHLGLVMAGEHPDLSRYLDGAADCIKAHVDLDGLVEAAGTMHVFRGGTCKTGVPPLGQRISVAHDNAFAFTYEHLLADWRGAGVEISFFSPMDDQPPKDDADAVFLPGGYPELHARKLANCAEFRNGMIDAAARGAAIYGECGGYMVLGKELQDFDGFRHEMLGLLHHSTSFIEPKLNLGYRMLKAQPSAPFSGRFAGHEFHYASVTGNGGGNPLFSAKDADGRTLPDMGHVVGNVSGSFGHLICTAPE